MKIFNPLLKIFIKYYNIFLDNGLKNKNSILEKKKVHLINFYSIFFLINILFMAIFNIFEKTNNLIIISFKINYYIIITLAITFIIIINSIVFHKIKNIKIVTNINTILFIMLLMFDYFSGGKNGTGLFWLIILPIGVLIFIELKQGTIYFLISLIIQIIFKDHLWNFSYSKIYKNYDSLFFRIIFIEILLYIVAFYLIKNRNDQYNEIDKLNNQKINLFINLTHETKTPLSLINNYLDKYIKKNGITEELLIIKDNLDKMTNDIINYFDIEKLERNYILYNHDNIINFSNILKIKTILFKEIASSKKIKINLNIIDNIYIKINQSAIDRILNNLFENAIKYNNENGNIDVRLTKFKNNVEFVIEDTGIGINEEEIKYIFDPFYQSSKEKKCTEGIGMGLAIVKKIVDEINAKIMVSSKKNKGTIFKIFFDSYKLMEGDRINEDVKYTNLKSNKNNNFLKKTKYNVNLSNIFFVEDNIELLLFMQDSMKDIYNFYYAFNGKDALEKLEFIPRPDIIISDIMMDEMDGYDFLKNINNNSNFKSIPFIFLTAKYFEKDRINGLRKGAIDFISKPFSIEVLLMKIDSLIKNKELNNEVVLENIEEAFYNFFNKKSDLNINKNENEKIDFDLIGKLYSEYGISKKEFEVVTLLKKGMNYKDISSNLNISINTVRTYIKRIFLKCRVKSTRELLNLINEN